MRRLAPAAALVLLLAACTQPKGPPAANPDTWLFQNSPVPAATRTAPLEGGGRLVMAAKCANNLDERPALEIDISVLASDGGPLPFYDNALNLGGEELRFAYHPKAGRERQAVASIHQGNMIAMVFGQAPGSRAHVGYDSADLAGGVRLDFKVSDGRDVRLDLKSGQAGFKQLMAACGV